jgi:hypothetical protein
MPLAETSPFAPVGELLVVDGRERVVCHLCGRALAMLGATHLRQHGWTAVLYREAFGLRRGASLCAPALTERRRLLGLERYETNCQLRQGPAVGQAMARSGRLLELSHRTQPTGSARAQTRRRAGERTASVRQRSSAAAQARLHARLVELGFGGDLAGYLRDGYARRRLPVSALWQASWALATPGSNGQRHSQRRTRPRRCSRGGPRARVDDQDES